MFIGKREDALFLGPGGTGKSHLAQAIGQVAIQQGYRVMYRETHVLLDELRRLPSTARARSYGIAATVPLLIVDDFGMSKLPATAAEDLLEIVMRRYERASTLLTSNRPVEDWGKLLGDVAAVTAMLDRILHHGHVLNGPRSWRTKAAVTSPPEPLRDPGSGLCRQRSAAHPARDICTCGPVKTSLKTKPKPKPKPNQNQEKPSYERKKPKPLHAQPLVWKEQPRVYEKDLTKSLHELPLAR